MIIALVAINNFYKTMGNSWRYKRFINIVKVASLKLVFRFILNIIKLSIKIIKNEKRKVLYLFGFQFEHKKIKNIIEVQLQKL